jgi:hypothetical protein
MQDNPDAAYSRWMQQFDPTSQLWKYAAGQHSRLAAQWESKQGQSPELSFLEYLMGSDKMPTEFQQYGVGNQQGQNIKREFNSLDPYARGERPQQYVGRVRFLGL